MGLSEDIRQQLINSFKTEQSEHVQKINEGLLALEKNPGGQDRQTLLDEIFREAHSLKGAARAVGLTTTESLSHGIEELLLNAREGRLSFSPELFDLLYQALDAVELLVERVEAGESTPPAKVLALLAQLEEFSATEATEQDNSSSPPATHELPDNDAESQLNQVENPKSHIPDPESQISNPKSKIQNRMRPSASPSTSWTPC